MDPATSHRFWSALDALLRLLKDQKRATIIGPTWKAIFDAIDVLEPAALAYEREAAGMVTVEVLPALGGPDLLCAICRFRHEPDLLHEVIVRPRRRDKDTTDALTVLRRYRSMIEGTKVAADPFHTTQYTAITAEVDKFLSRSKDPTDA